jgi:hypothetical protein
VKTGFRRLKQRKNWFWAMARCCWATGLAGLELWAAAEYWAPTASPSPPRRWVMEILSSAREIPRTGKLSGRGTMGPTRTKISWISYHFVLSDASSCLIGSPRVKIFVPTAFHGRQDFHFDLLHSWGAVHGETNLQARFQFHHTGTGTQRRVYR